MLPDFNRLRTFFHVHRLRSISAAASALHVTQPAVSQSLARLEEELGAQLFVRRHRAIVPTAAADALFSVVAPFVEALTGGIEQIRRSRHELVGTLRIGAPAELGAQRLPAVLGRFSGMHPGVSFELSLGHPSMLVPMLEEGRLDLGFVDIFDARRPAAPRLSGLQAIEVMDEVLVLVAAAHHEREHLQGQRTLARLSAARFVDYHPTAPAARSWFHHHFGRVPARLDLALAVESVQAVISAVTCGMGLGLVPAPTVERALSSGELVAITTRRRPLTNRISLLRVFDRKPGRLEREFVAFALKELGPAGGKTGPQ